MRSENLKLLLRSYIQCEQNQDELDGPGNLAIESDDPIRFPRHLGGDSYSNGAQTNAESLPFFQFAPSLEPIPVLTENVIEAGRELARFANEFSTAYPERSIIKFKDICVIKEPVEQTLSIPIIRNESVLQQTTKVSWKTCDKTAISGTHYTESSGEIIFSQGEMNKDIYIKILNSAGEEDDLHFTVELTCDGVYTPRPLTISLKKINNFDPPEKKVLDSLPRSLPFTVDDVKFALDNCLNARTFHMALTHLCSTTTVLDAKIALALKLSYLCLCKSSGNTMREDSILKVLDAFFKKDDYRF